MRSMEGGGAAVAGAEHGSAVRKKAEIDTSAPFRSVQEAVLLFGERILGGQVYAREFKEMHDETSEKHGNMTAELEETKQSLQKAKEESMEMATCLSFLQQELERTKEELHNLKQKESSSSDHNKQHQRKQQSMITDDQFLELEDIKFVEESENIEFQKKNYVTFADHSSLIAHQVVVPQSDEEHVVLQRHPSLRKSKKKALIPLIKGIFRIRGRSGVGPGTLNQNGSP